MKGKIYVALSYLVAIGLLYGCGSPGNKQNIPEELTVISVNSRNVKIHTDFNAIIQGINDIEIRPQVDGLLTRIYVDEGAFVHKGDPIFQIDERPFIQELNQAKANLTTAKATLEKAFIEKSRIERLAQNSVISEVQLRTAQAAYNEALGNVQQVEATVSFAAINLEYATITAPEDGFVGNFPYKTGSLASKSNPNPLTKLISNNTMYVYFSMSEKDFSRFNNTYKGNTIEEKIAQVPPIELILSDNNMYFQTGELDVVSGQFDPETGMIVFRASFANMGNILKSGTTGKIRLSFVEENHIVIPQKATFELQDRTFVFVLNNEKKAERRLVHIKRSVPNYYILNSGLDEGNTIILSGIGRLKDGTEITPDYQSFDSLLINQPLPF
jgi:RND family efflux transporter, MFP subunit